MHEIILTEVQDFVPSYVIQVTVVNKADQLNTWHPLLDSIGDGICLLDINSCILKCNSSMSAFLQKDTNEVVGKKCTELFSCGSGSDNECLTARACKSGRKEQRVVRKGNRSYRMSVDPVFDANGQITRTFHVFSEIPSTEINGHASHASGNGADSEDSRRLLSLGLVSSAVAHDFNNLLTGILGYSDLLLCTAADDSQFKSYVMQIKASAIKGAALVQNLMDRSAAECFPRKNSKVSELINDVVQTMAPQVPENVELHRVIASDILNIQINPTQVRQIIENLVLNAIEAIGEREGRVTISAHDMDCSRAFLDSVAHGSSLSEGRYLCIEVADTGIGMDAETVARAPRLFFSTKPDGRGLGLTAVERAIKQHEGMMRISSAPGNGTQVQVLIPMANCFKTLLHSCTGQQGAPLQA